MKVLIVLTSHNDLGNTGEKTGFWIEEFGRGSCKINQGSALFIGRRNQKVGRPLQQWA